MLRLVLKRMLSSRWMIICLLLGSIIATALVSCIPIYTNGILQRILTKDLENHQLETGEYPGSYHVDSFISYIYKGGDRIKTFDFFDAKIGSMAAELGLPIKAVKKEASLSSVSVYPADVPEKEYNPEICELTGIQDLEQHISLAYGRMPEPDPADGVYEALVAEAGMNAMKLVLDKIYTLKITTGAEAQYIKVRITGAFNFSDPNDLFWDKEQASYQRKILLNFIDFNNLIHSYPDIITVASWHYALDYYQIRLNNIDGLSEIMENQHKYAGRYHEAFKLSFPALDIIGKYNDRARQLSTMLWVLTVPVLLMIMFYVFMVSKLIVNHDENSIAVMKSRGASRLQIFNSYVLESLVISAIAMVAGPPAGLLLCTILGSSNGFLEFVQRSALSVSLSPEAYAYSLAIIAVLIVTMLIPVIISSKTTIVQHKQSKARGRKAPFWKKFMLDFIILGISLYGLYRYNQQMAIISTSGLSGLEIEIDPLLFLVSTLFVLGAGLIFLRVYPLMIRFIYWLGRKLWSPVFYVSLIQVGRSRGQEQFLMLFIILAISTGIFNANSARTINRSNEDKIRYSVGADISLMAVWANNRPPSFAGFTPPPSRDPIRWYEPNFNDYEKLEGVESVTKVITSDSGILYYGNKSERNVRVMGVMPHEFARIAWFRDDLMKHSIIDYLNLMTDYPTGFIVSSNLKERFGFKEGDTISITWGDQGNLEGTIYAFVDYWPTYNPNRIMKTGAASVDRDPRNRNQFTVSQTGMTQGLVVANMSYIQNKFAVQPYEVWIKKAPGATDKTINDDIANKGLRISYINYANQELIKMKNDPLIQGTNGALTLGFAAAMIITLVGFLIYWIISIQSRALHFGILRAMGLSLARVIGILAVEQVLLSGTAIVAGILIGGLTGKLYIPLLQMVYSSTEQVPPFRIVAEAGDYIKIYAVIGFMLLIGFTALWRLIARIKIVQAVKLGED